MAETTLRIPPLYAGDDGAPYAVEKLSSDTYRLPQDGKNYGYGPTSYLLYVFSKDGTRVWYGSSETEYLLHIPEDGIYDAHIVGEKPYIYRGVKNIPGFDPAVFPLPVGYCGWVNDHKGTVCAIKGKSPEVPSGPVDFSDTYVPADDADARVYQFGKGSDDCSYDASCGTRVREIVLAPRFPGGSRVTVGVVTDGHVNILDDKDQSDGEVLFTDKTRYWGRGGVHIPRLARALRFLTDEAVGACDALVLTGDHIDYLSHGAREVVKTEVFDKYPEALNAPGGHDFTKNMESGYPDRIPYEERRAYLQEVWPHDIDIASRKVGALLLIALNNGIGAYAAGVAEKLAVLLDEARAEGRTVLLFEHEPLATGYESDGALKCLDADAPPMKAVYNMAGAAHIGGVGRNDSEATRAVYALITRSADVIGGVFCGHRHYNYADKLRAARPDGTPEDIPQYVLRACAYAANGVVTKITVG